MTISLTESILQAGRRPDFVDRMKGFYASVDESVAGHRPTCWNHGVCCKFESFGHKLFVTSAELAYFYHGRRDDWRSPTEDRACPYQIDGLCTAREHRPLGCRIFFCDPAAQAWQPDEYESHLKTLKGICLEFGLEYRYQEWLSALQSLEAEFRANGHLDPRIDVEAGL